jgi:hypothetical protein
MFFMEEMSHTMQIVWQGQITNSGQDNFFNALSMGLKIPTGKGK